VLDDMQALGVHELRTGISWADATTPEGEAWYAWLLPQLARRVNVLPCFVDTPPYWGVAPKTSAPPGNLKSYADFLDVLITKHGKHFEWIELWNEPNDPRRWDAELLDPSWLKFSEMIGNAAYWARSGGRRRCSAGCGRSTRTGSG
jgi:CDP-paratose 2-epimerase